MTPPVEIQRLLVYLPFAVLGLYSLIIIVGNHWILRAGGTSAHENYPKVIEQLKTGFISISVGFLLFFLVIFGFVPSDAAIALVSVAAGMFGTIILKGK